jgi:hypothetical protein
MTTRREFLRDAAILSGGAALGVPAIGAPKGLGDGGPAAAGASLVVSAAAKEMLIDGRYNPAAVGRSFEEGLKELTGERTAAAAWSSLFGPDDVVGIKVNCIGAPRISTSPESIAAAVAGLRSAGVRENNIVIWDRLDREFQRTGLALNKGPEGLRVMGTSEAGESILPWVPGYDREVFLSYEDGTLRKFRRLCAEGYFAEAGYREIFNSLTWLWMLSRMGDERAVGYEPELRRLYAEGSGREAIKAISDAVADRFDGVTIPDEDKSCFSEIVTKTVTKLINIAVLKHNEDSGLTWAAKNVALGVTTNKVRFHIDYCVKAIPDILAMPCLKDKLVLHVGEAAKISLVSVAGAQMAYDNRIFFSRDPVALDRIGLDILEEKRLARGLESIRPISGHVAACARRGLGTDDLSRIERRELEV